MQTKWYNKQWYMCGFCLLLNIPIEHHHFSFPFFAPYHPPAETDPLPLNKHIQTHKLLLPQPPTLKTMSRPLTRRGPNQLTAHLIDTYKTNFEEIHPEQIIQVGEGSALGVQSILHLRGTHTYVSHTPGSYFLYNGEIWDTGNLPPIDQQNGENDAKWLHQALIGCRGSEEKILEMMAQIRGDFSIVLVEGDQIFLLKDYFGKRSLLLGMSENHLLISSVPFQHFAVREENEQGGDEENEETWKAKYEAEWASSRNKHMFEVPANCMISIRLRNGEAFWSHHPLLTVDLKKMGLVKIVAPEEEIKATIKQLLVQSVREITRNIREYAEGGKKGEKGGGMAVLFSGGIDSTLIARLLDLTLPKDAEIELINLAFREDAPDRQAARASFEQLQALSPGRQYRLVLVDRRIEDLQKVKKELLQSIYPKTTHMDFNIAAALHLASAVSQANIVATGLGADQIFAGYSRYRIAFKRAGYEEMENEMLFDMERLWIRNLGRDDRAIGMNGKQARYPFLYLPLWEYLRKVPLPILTEGNGEKQLLRKVAREMGLEKASHLKKKAIQFGTRLAKLSNIKSFGSNRKARGTYEYK